MSFFDRGKNKEGRNPPAGPTDKSEYSLFRKPADEAVPAVEPERSLRIVRGKGAVADDTSAPPQSDEKAESQSRKPADGAASSEVKQEPPRGSGLFSRTRKGAPPSVEEPQAVAQRQEEPALAKTGAEPSAAVDSSEPRSGGFLSRLKGNSPAPILQQEPTFTPPEAESRDEAEPPVAPSLDEETPASAEAVADEKAEKPASRKGAFLGLGAKSEKKAKPKAEKAPKKPAKKESTTRDSVRKPRGGSARNVHIYVQLENQREFFWALRQDHIEEVGRESVQSAASFSREDVAVRTTKSLSFKAAQDAALQEIGEPVHLVNRSKDLNYVYATREERPLTAGYRLLPGQQAVDRIIKRKKLLAGGKGLITGFTFTNSQGQVAVAILYHVTPDGAVTSPQVTLNPDRMDFVLNEFAKQRKINRKESEVVLFGNEDFLAEAGALQAYPVEPVWRGIPVSRLWRMAAVVSAAGALGSCGWTVLGYVQQEQISSHIAQLTAKQAASKEAASRLIGKSLNSFSQALSLDQEHVFDIAQQLWMPGTQLDVEAKPERATYHVRVPVVTNKTFNNRPSVDATPPKSQVDVALKIVAPQGCRKDTASVSGNMNEIEISVVCENRRSPLSGFRND